MSRARFLIDESLSVELAGLAWARGYQASHLRDLDLLGRKDEELAPVIFEGDRCFVTKNARDFRGPDDAKGSSGEYAGVDLHAGLVCIHGPPEVDETRDQSVRGTEPICATASTKPCPPPDFLYKPALPCRGIGIPRLCPRAIGVRTLIRGRG